jgi:Uma2 family endonuclease
MMMQPELQPALPTSDELPCSDDTPVDNEDQNLLPNVLLFLLASIWADRLDWYFGVDMAVCHTTGVNPRMPVVPDAFLSVGVERKKGGKSHKSYKRSTSSLLMILFHHTRMALSRSAPSFSSRCNAS